MSVSIPFNGRSGLPGIRRKRTNSQKGCKLQWKLIYNIYGNMHRSDATVLVFTNLGDHHLELLKLGEVKVGDEIIRVR